MRSKSARRRTRKRLARSNANITRNSLSLGRSIVAEEGTDVPELLPEMKPPADSLVLLTVKLLAGQVGHLGDVAREYFGMGAVEATNVRLEAPQVPGLDKRVQELHVTEGLEVRLL